MTEYHFQGSGIWFLQACQAASKDALIWRFLNVQALHHALLNPLAWRVDMQSTPPHNNYDTWGK